MSTNFTKKSRSNDKQRKQKAHPNINRNDAKYLVLLSLIIIFVISLLLSAKSIIKYFTASDKSGQIIQKHLDSNEGVVGIVSAYVFKFMYKQLKKCSNLHKSTLVTCKMSEHIPNLESAITGVIDNENISSSGTMFVSSFLNKLKEFAKNHDDNNKELYERKKAVPIFKFILKEIKQDKYDKSNKKSSYLSSTQLNILSKTYEKYKPEFAKFMHKDEKLFYNSMNNMILEIINSKYMKEKFMQYGAAAYAYLLGTLENKNIVALYANLLNTEDIMSCIDRENDFLSKKEKLLTKEERKGTSPAANILSGSQNFTRLEYFLSLFFYVKHAKSSFNSAVSPDITNASKEIYLTHKGIKNHSDIHSDNSLEAYKSVTEELYEVAEHNIKYIVSILIRIIAAYDILTTNSAIYSLESKGFMTYMGILINKYYSDLSALHLLPESREIQSKFVA